MIKRLKSILDFLKWYQDNKTEDFDYNFYSELGGGEIMYEYQYESIYIQRGYIAIWKFGEYHFRCMYFNQDVYDYWVNRKSTENAFIKHFYSKWNLLYEKFKNWEKEKIE